MITEFGYFAQIWQSALVTQSVPVTRSDLMHGGLGECWSQKKLRDKCGNGGWNRTKINCANLLQVVVRTIRHLLQISTMMFNRTIESFMVL